MCRRCERVARVLSACGWAAVSLAGNQAQQDRLEAVRALREMRCVCWVHSWFLSSVAMPSLGGHVTPLLLLQCARDGDDGRGGAGH